MSPNPILSICIPTYSRSSFLDQCLGVIVAQFETNPVLAGKMEVIVSDNASIDNTKEVVDKYSTRYNNIKYFVNEKNLGSDENYIRSVKHACGKYAWIIGDDDFILSGALDYVINFLEKNNVAIFTITSETFVEMSGVLKKRSYLDDVVIYSPQLYNEFFEKGFCIGLLSSVIFNRSMWLAVDRIGYLSGWSYYEIALKMIAKSNLPLTHVNYPMVATVENCDWVKNGTEFFYFINWKSILEKLPTFGYDKSHVNRCLSEFPRRLVTILLRAKGNGLKFAWKNLNIIWHEFYRSPFYLVTATIIFFVPNFLIRLARDFNKKFLKIKI